MSTKTFTEVFQDRIRNIRERAAAAGTSITTLCESTNVARATPDRWLKKAPKTIQLVDELEKALADVEAQLASAEQQ